MNSSMKNGYKLMANPNARSRITCSAYGCDMRSGTNAFSEIKMFIFPRNQYRRRRWELATRRANWKANSKSRLCCKHFITGKPSKDPNHPDYVPSIFVFNKNAQNLKKSLSKLQKKLDSSEVESSENVTRIATATQEATCGKGFCATCFSPESVSSAFNMSLAPLNQTLEQLMVKLKNMEAEREQLRNELASCREEIHELREAHQHCEVQSQSTTIHSEPNSFVSVPSDSESVSEILDLMYSADVDDPEPADVDDPESADVDDPESADVDDTDSFHSLYTEHNRLQLPDMPSKRKREKKNSIATNCNDVLGIIEQCPPPKKKRVFPKSNSVKSDSNKKSKGTCESSKSGKSSDSGSPITIVYLKR